MSAPDNAPWLSLKGIHFSRSGRAILSDISLDFRNRELILLTGHNGSGKTTLLRILAGLLKPDSVSIRYGANRHTGSWLRNLGFLRAQVCYLHQQPYLFDAPVFDNVAYGLRRRGLDRVEVERLVLSALEATALDHLVRRQCGELSGGERQRVAMVRAWVLKPRLLLLDEPVANMDKHSRRKCLALINQMQRDNITVMLTSHEPQQGALLVSRHLHLYQGRMVEKALPTEWSQSLSVAGIDIHNPNSVPEPAE